MVLEGEEGDDEEGEASVAITLGAADGGACGAMRAGGGDSGGAWWVLLWQRWQRWWR